jgi:hypothetical protein
MYQLQHYPKLRLSNAHNISKTKKGATKTTAGANSSTKHITPITPSVAAFETPSMSSVLFDEMLASSMPPSEVLDQKQKSVIFTPQQKRPSGTATQARDNSVVTMHAPTTSSSGNSHATKETCRTPRTKRHLRNNAAMQNSRSDAHANAVLLPALETPRMARQREIKM